MIGKLPFRSPWHVHALACAACATVVAIACVAWIAPRLELRRVAGQQRIAVTAVLQEESELKPKVATLQGQVDAAKALAKEASRANGAASGLNGRVAQLTDLASAHRLQIDGIEPGAAVTGGRQPFVPLRLTGRGGYRDVTAMLAQVRTALPDLGIDQIDLSAGTVGTAPQFVVRFQWFMPTQSASAR